ncbi:hypothetical protein FB451DRAFT_1389382 [Mycena latifolia]|nr:hypothetical protein FB451DRAFT_1389382 [Mycena latifolia]
MTVDKTLIVARVHFITPWELADLIPYLMAAWQRCGSMRISPSLVAIVAFLHPARTDNKLRLRFISRRIAPASSAMPAQYTARLVDRSPHSKSLSYRKLYQKSTDQEETAHVPTYGDHGHIIGFMSMEDRETVSKVGLTVCVNVPPNSLHEPTHAKVKRQDVAIIEGGSASKTVLD